MRYVADPLSEDPGVSPPPPPDASKVGSSAASAAAPKGKKGAAAGKKKNNIAIDPDEEGGRPAILKVLRQFIGEGYEEHAETAASCIRR